MAETSQILFGQSDGRPTNEKDGPALIPFTQTLYKDIYWSDETKRDTLTVFLREPFVKAGVTQALIDEWIQTIADQTKETGIDQYIAALSPLTDEERTHGIGYRVQYIEGTTIDASHVDWNSTLDQLNDMIEKSIPIIKRNGWTFDIRFDNLRVNDYGDVFVVDHFPIITDSASPFSLNIARDPCAFLIEHTGGILSSGNLYRLTNRATELDDIEREYWAIQAHERRTGERKNKPGGRYTLETAQQIALDISDILNVSPKVRFAGVYGSVARGNKPKVGDLDMFAVVDNNTFRQIVAINRESAFRRHFIRSVFYTPLKCITDQLDLPYDLVTKMMGKRKLTYEGIDSFIGMHLIALPENLDDETIQSELRWVIRHQPDAEFFVHVLNEAKSIHAYGKHDISALVDRVVPLSHDLGHEYWRQVNTFVSEEVERRYAIGQEYEKKHFPK